MSGAMRRFGEYLGLLEDTGRYDDEDGELGYGPADHDGSDHPTQVGVVAPRRSRGSTGATVADLSDRRRGGNARARRWADLGAPPDRSAAGTAPHGRGRSRLRAPTRAA